MGALRRLLCPAHSLTRGYRFALSSVTPDGHTRTVVQEPSDKLRQSSHHYMTARSDSTLCSGDNAIHVTERERAVDSARNPLDKHVNRSWERRRGWALTRSPTATRAHIRQLAGQLG